MFARAVTEAEGQAGGTLAHTPATPEAEHVPLFQDHGQVVIFRHNLVDRIGGRVHAYDHIIHGADHRGGQLAKRCFANPTRAGKLEAEIRWMIDDTQQRRGKRYHQRELG